MKDYYFYRPTQVAFYNVEDKCYEAGIAEDDRIICLCCGGVICIDELLEEIAEECPEVQAPIIELPWVNLREECLGNTMFNISTDESLI